MFKAWAPSEARLEFWPFFGPFRVQKIIFSFRKIFSQYSVPYRTRSPWNSEHSTSSTVPHRITHRQTHGISTKAYSFNDVKYTVFSIYLIRNHEHIANITYSPSIIYSLGPETKLGIPTLIRGSHDISCSDFLDDRTIMFYPWQISAIAPSLAFRPACLKVQTTPLSRLGSWIS